MVTLIMRCLSSEVTVRRGSTVFTTLHIVFMADFNYKFTKSQLLLYFDFHFDFN